jgi:MraZ protein
VFRGVAKLALDNKGRLAVPARHRDALQARCGGKLVLTADPSHCLLLYPLPEWEPIQKKLMGLSSFHDTTRSLQRLLVGHADDVELDGAGRILVPPVLRDYAKLDKHVALVGQSNRFEIWNEADWDAKWLAEDGALPNFRAGEMPPELDGFSL